MRDAAIRPARAADLARLAAIEDAAEQLFEGTPMAFVRDLPRKPPPATLPQDVFIWVSVGPGDEPMGFLEAEPHGRWLHILELSVHPAAQRRGRAAALVAHARAEARARGFQRLSLTTDRDIPFNGPMYRRFGFEVLAPSDQPAWLSALLAVEVAHGFDPARRVAMSLLP
jgi:GNAT superfamily N-acetyltransferase